MEGLCDSTWVSTRSPFTSLSDLAFAIDPSDDLRLKASFFSSS